MITPDDVKAALYDLLCGEFPEETDIHLDILPANFTRPCIFLELYDVTTNDVNCGTIEEVCKLAIVCFVKVDVYGNSPENDLMAVCTRVQSIFRQGVLAVKDRWVRCAATYGKDPDMARFEIAVTYYEDRQSAAPLPPMQDIQIRKKDKNGTTKHQHQL